jgi:hypothetical protein
LYSVCVNRNGEDGRDRWYEPRASDDIAVKMPVPPLRKR